MENEWRRRESNHGPMVAVNAGNASETGENQEQVTGGTKPFHAVSFRQKPANDAASRPHDGHGRRAKDHPEHAVWREAKRRCLAPTCKDYPRYGGRGIRMADRWLGRDGFRNFLADMGPRPSPDHTLDRIDVNGPYAPDNCRWATWVEQNSNTRRTRLLELDGVSMTIAAWSRAPGSTVGRQRIASRLNHGWPPRDAVFAPPGAKKPRAA